MNTQKFFSPEARRFPAICGVGANKKPGMTDVKSFSKFKKTKIICRNTMLCVSNLVFVFCFMIWSENLMAAGGGGGNSGCYGAIGGWKSDNDALYTCPAVQFLGIGEFGANLLPQKVFHLKTSHISGDPIGSHNAFRLEHSETQGLNNIISTWDINPTVDFDNFITTLNFISINPLSLSEKKVLTLTSEGPVGINTSLPQAALHIKGNIIVEDVEGPASLLLKSRALTTGKSWSIQSHSDGSLLFRQGQENNFEGTPFIAIIPNGNVGIGEGFISPQKQLHIKTAHTTGTGGTHMGIRLEHTSTHNANSKVSIWDIEPDVDITNNFIKLLRFRSPATNKTVLTLTDTGNVGIGTMNPGTKLHIENNGNVRITLKDASNQTGRYFQIEQDGDLVSFNDDEVKQIISMNLTSGNVGIGTTGPGSPLEIVKTTDGTQDLITIDNPSSANLVGVDAAIRFRNDGNQMARIFTERDNNNFNIQSLQLNSSIRFLISDALNSGEKMKIDKNGNVGIGVTNPQNKLEVCGIVKAKEIITVSTSWCDYVFDANYKRMSYKEKARYIKHNKHLPEVESGKFIEQHGLALSKNIKGITHNVEENTLDIIDLYELIEQQKNEISKLKSEIEELKQQ